MVRSKKGKFLLLGIVFALLCFIYSNWSPFKTKFSDYSSYDPNEGKVPYSDFSHGTYLSLDCKIFDKTGSEIRNFPYESCLYLEDGSLVAFDHRPNSVVVQYLNSSGKKVWERSIRAHHMINFVRERQAVIFLASEDKVYKGELTRFDYLVILDHKTGRTLAEWHFFDHIDEILLKSSEDELPKTLLGSGAEDSEAKAEATHANSIFEVPENAMSGKIPGFEKGNIFVNFHIGRASPFFILDKDLSKILWVSKNKYYVHDARIIPSGEILFFSNYRVLENNDIFRKNEIFKIHPLDERVTWEYKGEKNPSFYYQNQGSVQLFEDGGILYADHSGKHPRVKVFDRDGKQIIEVKSAISGSSSKPKDIMRARMLVLDDFLKNSHQ